MKLALRKIGFKDLVKNLYQKFKLEPIWCLIIATSLMLCGRAWKYFFFETSYREIFWNHKAFGWFIENLIHIDWNHYLANPAYDANIMLFKKGLGLFYFLSAIIVVVIPRHRAVRGVLIMVAISQIPQAYFQFNGSFYNWALLLEFTAQFSAPLLLWMQLRGKIQTTKVWCKLVVAITFICHGLYACGVYNVPQKFLTMCMKTLAFSKENALLFLTAMGVLDFIAALALYFKNTKILRVGLWYMIVWGGLTALARPWAHFYSFDAFRSLFQHLPDFLIRAPHYMLPLFLLMTINKPVRTDL